MEKRKIILEKSFEIAVQLDLGDNPQQPSAGSHYCSCSDELCQYKQKSMYIHDLSIKVYLPLQSQSYHQVSL